MLFHSSAWAAVKVASPPDFAWPKSGEAAVATQAGGLLGTSGPDTPIPIASVAKVMTAYLVLLGHPLAAGQPGPELTITAAEASHLPARLAQGESILPVEAGEHLSEYQALEGLLIPSADNIADALARFDAGSTTAFVAKMNATAKALGLNHTTYTDPSGLDGSTKSTAIDQVRLAESAMRLPVFAAIVDERTAVLPVAGTVTNYNSLVGTDGFVGIKTGSTNAAGGCLVFAVRESVGGHPVTIFGAVLGQTSGAYISAALDSARQLADSVMRSDVTRTLVPAGTAIISTTVDGERLRARTARPLAVAVPAGTAVRIRFAADGGRAESPDTTKTVGYLEVNTIPASRVPVILPKPSPPSIMWRLAHLI